MIKLKDLLNENSPGYENRQFGDPLPTIKDIAREHQKKKIKEENIDPVAFGCVINMAFNLGLPRLLKFKNFQYHLNKCEYESASSEMLDSRWAKQVPNRVNELAETMRNI